MAINVTNYISAYSGAGQALISEETRRKLIALGIDPSVVTSESQAKIIIEKVQESKEAALKSITNNTETFAVNNIDTSSEIQNEKNIILTMNYYADINKILLGL